MKYRQCFTVEGRGTFPFDMLRYDHCWPDRGEDSTRLETDDLRQVKLARHVDGKRDAPTVGRWESFGWTIVHDSLDTARMS